VTESQSRNKIFNLYATLRHERCDIRTVSMLGYPISLHACVLMPPDQIRLTDADGNTLCRIVNVGSGAAHD
jgi:hypothetical protein